MALRRATIATVDESAAGINVITGASRGIGRLLVEHLAGRGDRVVAVARQSRELESLGAVSTAVTVMALDVTDRAAVGAAFSSIVNDIGPLGTVITCAGSIDALGPVVDVDPDLWWSAVAVDLRGTMLVAQAALATMLPRRRGRIVTIYGNLGDRGGPHLSAFAVAKAGVARLTETLANEVKDMGVVVLGMHPGFVHTPMTERLARSEEGQRWLPRFGVRVEERWGDGESAVHLVEQILAGAADEFSGRTIYTGEDLQHLAERIALDPELRRLRLQL